MWSAIYHHGRRNSFFIFCRFFTIGVLWTMVASVLVAQESPRPRADAARADVEGGGSVLLITFESRGSGVASPSSEGWTTFEAVTGSNRTRRAMFGLSTGIAPALVNGDVSDWPRDLHVGHRVGESARTSRIWVSTRDRARARLLRGLVPEVTRYRRLRSVVRELEEAAGTVGFYWVDVAEAMGERAANTVERLANTVGDGQVMIVATTTDADTQGHVPVWIRRPGDRGETLIPERRRPLTSLDSVAAAVHHFLALPLSPLASAPWPAQDVIVTESWRADGRRSLSARHGGEEVEVAWDVGRVSSCWERSAAVSGCRWTRSQDESGKLAPGRQEAVEGDPAGVGARHAQIFRQLENRLLWILERSLE